MRDYSSLTFSNVTLFPAWAVKITRQDGIILRINNADESFTASAQTFTPLPGCDISNVRHIIGGEPQSVEIKFAHSDSGVIDTGDLNNGVWDGATVQIYPVNRASPSLGDAIFTGTIQPVSINPIGGSGSFDCRGVGAKAEAVIQTYQPMCRTDLFSSLCQLVATDFDHAGTVGTIVDRFNITVAGLASPPADGWFNQGVGVSASGFRFEISRWVQSTLTLTLALPLCVSRFTAGQGLTLYPGCDKTAATCKAKFNNIINFQGEHNFLGINSIVGV